MEPATLQASELEKWFDHLAHVFQTTGRDYFVRHWQNDPFASFEVTFYADIFVVHDVAHNNIVSTVKVYRREFYFEGRIYKVGGIGEVSTKPEYQSQGLARKLLDLSIPLMIRSGTTFSTLSASKARGYYERLGWQVVPFNISHQKFNIEKLLNRTHQNVDNIKPADFTEEQAKQLIPLHHFYSQHFNGPLCRSNIKYWTQWVKSESGDNAFVVLEPNGKVAGFACFGVVSPGILVVKDFFVGQERWTLDQGRDTLQQLLEHFMKAKQQEIGTSDLGEAVVKYPSAIVDQGGKLYMDESIAIEKKESYLYRVFGGDCPKEIFIQRMASSFVFWDVDKF